MKDLKKAYFAGGCFWCTEAIFSRIKGVIKVLPGYTGGGVANPKYKQVCLGITGHAEAVEISFDEKIISYNALLEVFFDTHNPTSLNKQGNDLGTQYRSAIYCHDEVQKNRVNDFIVKLTDLKRFPKKIVTEVNILNKFYVAEIEHKEYYDLNFNQPYCRAVISPKIKKFMDSNKKLIK